MRTILCTVGRMEFVGGGRFMIGVRNCRDELRRGDRLRVREKNGAELAVEFCVDEIRFYDRIVDVVDSGHTAQLFFPNALASCVRLGDELHGQSND